MGRALVTFLVCIALASIANATFVSEKLVSLYGAAECVDCIAKNINEAIAYSGLNVAVYCKVEMDQFQIKGVGKLDEDGKYSVKLPADVVNSEGGLKKDCFAQLHSGLDNKPCPAAAGSYDSSKLVVNSIDTEKHIFGTIGKLSFVSETCASAFFWWYKPIPKFPWYCPPKYPQQPPTYGMPSRPSYSPPSRPSYSHPSPPY